MATSDTLPLHNTLAPRSAEELAGIVRDSFAAGTAIYPIGGGTSLAYGMPAKTRGTGVSLASLNRVIDYPARDMTITVEAGITMASLAAMLAAERQQLPIDVPHVAAATLGGVIATNWNGLRRYGLGTVRDYVIGISAVDGRGMPFKGGGRVVKNVAGYDFCKLLTGSFGTLGVITQVTLRVRPLPQKSMLVATSCADMQSLDALLTVLAQSQTTPVSLSVLAGSDWRDQSALGNVQRSGADAFYVVVGLEGSEPELDWMVGQLQREWQALGLGHAASVIEPSALQPQIVEWTADDSAALILKANVRPSGVVPFINAAREVDSNCSVLAYAGNGVVFVKFQTFPATGLSRVLIGKLQPTAAALGGHVVLISNPSGSEMTLQSVWGGNEGSVEVMRAVKRNFDPKGILNPGRFVI